MSMPTAALDDDRPGGSAVRSWSVRTRVLSLMLTLVATGFVLSGVVLYAVQLTLLDDRVEQELMQARDGLLERATGDARAKRPPADDLDALFLDYLGTSVTAPDEDMMALVDGLVAYRAGGTREFDITDDQVRPVVLAALDPVITSTQSQGARRDVVAGGHELRLIGIPVLLEGDPRRGFLVMGVDIDEQRREINDLMRTYGLVAVGTVLLTGLVGYFVTGRLLRPLAELREATSSISSTDLARRVDVSQADTDVAQLGVTFNQMLDRLAAGMADQRQFLDDAAHELRTPLTIVRGNLELLNLQDSQDVAQTRELVLDETDRMRRLVDDLLVLAQQQRPDFLRLGQVDVNDLAHEIMDRVHTLGDRRWVLGGEPSGTITADRQRVLQAVIELCNNAVKFSTEGDPITVRVDWSDPTPEVAEQRSTRASRCLVISVEDVGSGIEAEDLGRIFDRFGRGSGVGHVEGSGLGLPIVSAIAAAHDGMVTARSRPGKGSIFQLWLPARV